MAKTTTLGELLRIAREDERNNTLDDVFFAIQGFACDNNFDAIVAAIESVRTLTSFPRGDEKIRWIK